MAKERKPYDQGKVLKLWESGKSIKDMARFRKVNEEVDHDGSQTLVKQYWTADCGCQVEITLVIPHQ